MKKTTLFLVFMLLFNSFILMNQFMVPVVSAASPTVTTNSTTNITETSVTLNGFLSNDGGEGCSVWFEYGTSDSYGNSIFPYPLDFSSGEHTIDSSFNGASSVYACDVDDDGDIDVLGAASQDDEITWWENDGSESFTEHTIDSSFNSPYSVYACDVDGDDDVDVLGGAWNDGIAWWENDGSESFTEHTINGSFNGAKGVYACDVDDDGDIDVLGAAAADDYITWWENDGSESFTEHTIDSSFNGANSVYATDVDGDGDIDVLGAAYDADDITWWENDGSESFTEHTIDSFFNGASSVYACDVDDDGDIDVLGAAAADDIVCWENDGSEGFTKHTIDSNFNGAKDVYATDVDGDGDIDVLGAAFFGDDITWWENNQSKNSPLEFSYSLTGLSPSTTYHYRAVANNSDGESYGSDMTFHTMPPDSVTNQSWSLSSGTLDLTLNWTKGNYSDYTLIRRSADSYPSSVTDGTLVYNSTGNGTVDTSLDQAYLYTFWAYNSTWNSYSSPVFLNWSASWLNCYNENNASNISCWTVEISNSDGSEVYLAECVNNSHIINISDMPMGEEVTFTFSADGYRPRSYVLSVRDVINLDAFLFSENESELYLLTVVDGYDNGIDNSKMSIKTLINGSYKEVSVLYTHSNGQVEVYLRPFTQYKFTISKSGYITEHENYIPTDSIFTQEFQLLLDLPESYVEERLWDNISWNIDPDVEVHRSNITFYFNISSGTGQIDWFRMRVQYFNESVGDWVTVFSDNQSSSVGGSISFTCENKSGRYQLDAWFKKNNFSEFKFGDEIPCRQYVITWESLTESLEEVPDSVLFLVIICLAIAATAVLLGMGAGDLSGLAGLTVMGIGAMFAPGLMVGAMAFWQVVLVAGIAYFSIGFLMGRF